MTERTREWGKKNKKISHDRTRNTEHGTRNTERREKNDARARVKRKER